MRRGQRLKAQIAVLHFFQRFFLFPVRIRLSAALYIMGRSGRYMTVTGGHLGIGYEKGCLNLKITTLKMLLLTLFSLILCACQTDRTDSDVTQQAPQSIHQMLAQVYVPVITENDIESPRFSFIYLDEDDIPELVILDRTWDKYSIYTVKDGNIKCLVDFVTTVEMSYYEHKNIVSAFYRSNGGGDEGEYTSTYYQLNQYPMALTDDTVPSFSFSYQAVYDENGDWTGDGINKYYKLGEEIDKAAYDQIFVDLDISQMDDTSCFSENGLSFTKEEILAYLETEAAAEAISQ